MSRFNQLSAREWEVIEQLLQGKSNKLIASSLSISVSTVEFHLNNIYAKSDVRSRLELILELWKTTGKMDIKELGYSPVDNLEKGFENVEDQATYQYGRIRKTMRFYRTVLVASVIAILLPFVLFIIDAVRRPDSITIWRGIFTWVLPAVAILILLLIFPRISFQPLAKLAGIFLVVLLGFGVVTILRFGYFFSTFGLGMWLFPYLLGAGGILIAARNRSRELDSGTPGSPGS